MSLSTEDQRRELGEAIQQLKRRTGAARVALVANSRGGFPCAAISKMAEVAMSATPVRPPRISIVRRFRAVQ